MGGRVKIMTCLRQPKALSSDTNRSVSETLKGLPIIFFH